MFLTRLLPCLIIALTFGAFAAPHVNAQNPFAPVIQVNDDVITRYELQQRQLFYSLISPGRASEARAREELIKDRLRRQAVRAAGLNVAEQDILDGMSEFAGRANLNVDEFVRALEARGVSVETFRDFVSVGLGWRDLIRARFGTRVEITPQEIDRALAASVSGSSVRVLLSEIIMPAPPQQAQAVLARAERISQTTSLAEFSSFARRFSATPSRGRGGRLDWSPISNLPPVLRPLVLALGPGEVTDPIPIPNAVALFQLRAIEESDYQQPDYSAIEYAQYFIAGGRSDGAVSQAAQLRTEVDVCDDLYGIAQGQPEEVLVRQSQKPEEIPADIALELAKLDNNEVSTALTTADGQNLVFLMLCGRTAAVGEDVSRDDIAAQLRQDRLGGLADSLLDELRADARIRDK